MPWVAQDDHYFHNPKARAIGPLGRELFSASWCYCSIQRNDGTFAVADIPVIAALAQVETGLADLLFEAGMWHTEGTDCPKCRSVGQTMPVPSGMVTVHQYLEQNRSREQIEADSERARKAALARHAKADGDRQAQADGSANGNAPSNATGSADRTALPSHPKEKNTPSSSGNSQGTRPPVDNPDDEGFLAAAFDHYAQLQLDRQPAGQVRNKARYRQRTRDNAVNDPDLGAKAHRWHAGYDVTPQHLAQCLVDGKAPASQYRRKAPA